MLSSSRVPLPSSSPNLSPFSPSLDKCQSNNEEYSQSHTDTTPAAETPTDCGEGGSSAEIGLESSEANTWGVTHCSVKSSVIGKVEGNEKGGAKQSRPHLLVYKRRGEALGPVRSRPATDSEYRENCGLHWRLDHGSGECLGYRTLGVMGPPNVRIAYRSRSRRGLNPRMLYALPIPPSCSSP